VRLNYHANNKKGPWIKAEAHRQQVLKFFKPVLEETKPTCYQQTVKFDKKYESYVQQWYDQEMRPTKKRKKQRKNISKK